MLSRALQHIDKPVGANEQKLTLISDMRILGAIKRIYQEQWLIWMDCDRDSNEST